MVLPPAAETDVISDFFSLMYRDFIVIKNAFSDYPQKKPEKDRLYLAVARAFSGTVIFSGLIQTKNSIKALPSEGNLLAIAWGVAHIAAGLDLFIVAKKLTTLINTKIDKPVGARIVEIARLPPPQNPHQVPSPQPPNITPRKLSAEKPIPEAAKTPLNSDQGKDHNQEADNESWEILDKTRLKDILTESIAQKFDQTVKKPAEPLIPPKPLENIKPEKMPQNSPVPPPPQENRVKTPLGPPPPIPRRIIKIPAIDVLNTKHSLEIAMELAQDTYFYALWIFTQNFWAKKLVNYFSTPIH